MANRTLPMTDALHAYLVDVSVDEHPVLAELRSETAARDNAVMQIGPEQGAFMAWIVKLIGARRGVEVGTFTGASCATRSSSGSPSCPWRGATTAPSTARSRCTCPRT